VNCSFHHFAFAAQKVLTTIRLQPMPARRWRSRRTRLAAAAAGGEGANAVEVCN
jgi:hypothetical protein